MLPQVSFVIGGASSGKTGIAERMVLGTGLNPVYIATAEPLDGGMKSKIEEHRRQRGTGWRTEEASGRADAALASVKPGEAAVFDCVTMWLAERLQANADLDADTGRLLAAFADAAGPVVAVSNETGWGGVPPNALARRFNQAQGIANQRIAAASGLALAAIAGMPVALKGVPPPWL